MKLYVYSLWLVAGVQSVNGKFAVTRRIMGLPTWARGVPRGGSSGVDTTIEETTTINTTEEEVDFSSKVQSAMKKFGIVGVEEDSQCENGVCALPTSSVKDDKPVKSESSSASDIAKDMGVSESIAFAALAAAKGDEALAREIIVLSSTNNPPRPLSLTMLRNSNHWSSKAMMQTWPNGPWRSRK